MASAYTARHGDSFVVTPHYDCRGFTISCACGSSDEVLVGHRAPVGKQLARFWAEHGQHRPPVLDDQLLIGFPPADDGPLLRLVR